MHTASTAFHLLGALRRAIGRVVLWFFLPLLLSVIAVEAIGYFVAGHPATYHPTLLTHIAAAVLGLALGYAAALTVLVGEVVRFFVEALKSAESDLKNEVSGGAKLMGSVVQSVENLERKL